MAASIWLFSFLAAQTLSTAVSALESGKLDEAATAFAEIVRQKPDDPDANYYLGLARFRQGRPGEARPFLERATVLAPSKPAAWKVLGLVLLGGNQYPQASVPLGQACKLEPADEDNCYLFARSLFLQGRYDEAVKPFETALRAAPAGNQATVHRAAALNLEELGSGPEAEQQFREAVRLYRPSGRPQPDPRVDYGAFLIRQGRANEALEFLQPAAAAAPRSARVHGELGRALLELDRPAEAVGPLNTALELDPNAWSVRLLLGKAYLRLGRTEEGERQLRLGREGWARQEGSSKGK